MTKRDEEDFGEDGFVLPDEAVRVTVSAAAVAGVPADDAQVVRVGENGVVVLPGAEALARVVPGGEAGRDVGQEIAVPFWLASQDVPVVRPVRSEPILVGPYVVSFWEYLAGAGAADLVTLARCLHQLHRVQQPGGLLPRLSPFSRFNEQMMTGAALNAADRAFLCDFRDRLAARWKQAPFELGEAVLHGDAHMENLLVTSDGRHAFVDLEAVCVGPPEWDLTLSALYYECGWFTEDQYIQFAETYGYDVRLSPGWPVLREIAGAVADDDKGQAVGRAQMQRRPQPSKSRQKRLREAASAPSG
ncbi:phosphotransferase family protein [Micromonospora sp. NPDC000442]|uniref:phosphotransferase family protein n=1 Tax=Micromonospora sp. NPDC000442 TaxID=3364217 RepID=UPI003690A0F1